jgi:CRP-like cAMP-binding protein
MQKLITYINSLVRFSPESWETLKPLITRKTFEKGELLLKAGEVCNSLYFIDQGFVRAFSSDTETNSTLHFDGEFVTSISSFSTGEASAYSIEACEPVTVLVLDKSGLQQAGSVTDQIAILGQNCLNYIASGLEAQADLINLYTPSERYEYIARNKPHLLKRVPPHILASYIGMSRERLSHTGRRRMESRYAF